MGKRFIKWKNELDQQVKATKNEEKIKELGAVRELLKKQTDREYCTFEFQNNLKKKLKIKYIKISHVFEGREAFVYHACDVKHQGTFYVKDYAIGIDLNHDQKGKDFDIDNKKVLKRGEHKRLNPDNVYDKIYVQFVIDDEGKEVLYHHCYKEIFDKADYDLFKSEGKLDRAYLSLIHIRLFFDPLFNDHTQSDFKMRLSISTPLKDTIRVVEYNK